jgi:hypothetical protein
VIGHLVRLTLGALVFGVLTAVPAARLWGPAMYVNAAVAGALCLVPTAIALLTAEWTLRSSPQQQLLAVLGGTGLRMMVVLTAGAALSKLVPFFAEQELIEFWGWILIYYFFTLTLEVVLLVRGRSPIGAKDS